MEGCLKMNRVLKGLIACMILIPYLAIFISTAMAQVGFGFPPYPYFPSCKNEIHMGSNKSTIIQGNILIEDFEYLDSIYNQGWSRQGWIPKSAIDDWLSDPSIIPVSDLQNGSWVLDVSHPVSVTLLSTPDARPRFTYNLFTPSTRGPDSAVDYINLDTYPIVSFDYKATHAPREFEFDVMGLTKSDHDIMLKIIFNDLPEETFQSQQDSPFIKIDKKNARCSEIVTIISQQSVLVTIYILDELVDNFWHEVWVDVFRTIKEAVDHYDDIESKGDWDMDKASQIELCSYNFRIDNIFFISNRNCSYEHINPPNLFEMGPLYAQIFKSYRFLFIADYEGANIIFHDINGHTREYFQITDLMLNPDNFLLVQDPNDPNDPVVRFWTDLGADPDKFGKEADPNLKALFGRDFTVDLGLPIFADPVMRVGGSMAKSLIDRGGLGFYARFDGYYDNFGICPLPVYPYDGMPTYLPVHYNTVNVIAALGKPYYPPELVYSLEGALWNAGITIWPNIAIIDYTPQYFEEHTVTIEVTDGINNDIRRFPINVVQYPVENHPPALQLPLDDLIFFVGEDGESNVNFIDPDCFIFSMSSPDTENKHSPGFPVSKDFRTDMHDLVREIKSIAINGQVYTLPNAYCNSGAWCGCDTFNSSMDDFDYCHFRNTGLIRFTPQSEKILDIGINVSDAKGGNGFNEIKIISISKSDMDGDLIYDLLDNCPFLSNMDQADSDEDGIGDLCDNCPGDPNPGRADIDQDRIGDNCDLCPNDTNNDIDSDDCDNATDKLDDKQGKPPFPNNQFWPQVSNFFGFMPQVLSGYRPNIKTGQFMDNIQMPYIIPSPGSYGIHVYWPALANNPIMNYSYSEGLSPNDFLSPLKDPYMEDSFMYPIWIFPVMQSWLKYYY